MKTKPSDLKYQAEKMLAAGIGNSPGEMPSLETVLRAIASTREEFAPKIRAARREAKVEQVRQIGQRGLYE